MHICNRKQFKYKPDGITADAAEIGLKPGEWPDFISIVDDEGNGYLVHFAGFEKRDDTILFARYYDSTGKLPEVRIFND